MLLKFEDKTAVVTGGSNGIGFAAARLLRSLGCDVWILDLAAERPVERAAEIGARGAEADVTDEASLNAAFEAVGAVDILIANAGAVTFRGLTELSLRDWQRIINVNLTGMFQTIQLAARSMKERRKGAIVLTASTNSFDGEANLIAYNASKAGVMGLLHTAANELGPYGIRVNAVCPGLIRTRLTEELFARPKLARRYFQHIPMGRSGTPDEVANAMVFLASDAASFITGADLFVDGGQMACKYSVWSDDSAEFIDDHWRFK